LRAKTESLGYKLNDEELSLLFARFKELADRKKLLDEADIHSLLLLGQGTGTALASS
jgi:2-isopropylmalate synthase